MSGACRRRRVRTDMAQSFPSPSQDAAFTLTSREGDLVLDPFMGGGTTAVAAVVMGRRCLGFDISEKYINIAVKRAAVAADRGRQLAFEQAEIDVQSPSTEASEVRGLTAGLTSPTRPVGTDSLRTEASEVPRSQSA